MTTFEGHGRRVARFLDGLPDPISERRRWAVATVLGALVFRVALFYSRLIDVMFVTGDSPEYRDLAESLLHHGVFGLDGVPKMNRTPGYPAFLAAIFATLGRSQFAVTSIQIILDALVCAMVVDLALRAGFRRGGVLACAVLSVTCAFTAAFSYQLMTETLYTFLLTACAWVLPGGDITAILDRLGLRRLAAAGLILGAATLVRPSTAVSIAAFPAFALYLVWRRVRWGVLAARVVVAVAVFGAAAAVTVVPWMIRNRTVFHAEYEKPDHSNVTLLGFKTDVPVYRHWYTASFMKWRRSYEEPFVMERPEGAPVVVSYVYPDEETDVQAAFARLAHEIRETSAPVTAETLAAFDRIADKRYARAPRLHVTAPISRVLKFWIVPRVSALLEGKHGGNVSKGMLVGLTLYNCVYVLAGFLGLFVWRASERPAWAMMTSLLVSQTALYSFWHSAPQSRYGVPFFPVLCVGCGALVSVILERGIHPRAYRDLISFSRQERLPLRRPTC